MENTHEIFDKMPEFSRIGSFSFLMWAILIGLFLALVVNMGPAFITLVQTSLHRGFRSAAWFATGVILNDVMVVALCILTSVQVVMRTGFEAALACIGAGVILLLDTATPNFKSRLYLEHAIRVTAAVGEWLLDREILGRFFIDSEEIALDGGSESRKNLLDALARVPPASLAHAKQPAPWAPAARPMDPVLRIGLYENDESLVNKHIVV